MDGLKIHIARDADLPRITDYYRELYKGEEKQVFYSSKIVLKKLRSGQFVLVAKLNGKVVGYLWITWYEHIKHKGIAYLEELYVDSDYRRRKAGSILISNALERLKKIGIESVYVAVGSHMKDAHKFYGRLDSKLRKKCGSGEK